MSNETLDKIKEELSKLTAPQLSELISSLKEEWNVSDEAPVAMAVAGAAGAEGAEVAEEKSEFTVVLKSIGDKKVNVIKEVKAITQLPLGDAKKLVDEAPKPVKEGVPKAEAEEMKKKLEEAGASVELQ